MVSPASVRGFARNVAEMRFAMNAAYRAAAGVSAKRKRIAELSATCVHYGALLRIYEERCEKYRPDWDTTSLGAWTPPDIGEVQAFTMFIQAHYQVIENTEKLRGVQDDIAVLKMECEELIDDYNEIRESAGKMYEAYAAEAERLRMLDLLSDIRIFCESDPASAAAN